MLSKEASSNILKVFGTTRPGIEPRSSGSLANTLPTRPMSRLKAENIEEVVEGKRNEKSFRDFFLSFSAQSSY